jgi:putative ABC transport system substrate-binding protein
MNKKIGGLVLATVIPAFFHLVEAQQPKKIPRIGWLTGVSLSLNAARIEAARQGLREFGYVEGGKHCH